MTHKEKMETYKNLGGESGVSAFEIGLNYIKVKFSTGAIYKYSYAKAGKMHVDEMKLLAQRGRGLNSYINTNVKFLYD